MHRLNTASRTTPPVLLIADALALGFYVAIIGAHGMGG